MSVLVFSLSCLCLQATVQATLALLPLDQVNALIPKNDPRYAKYHSYAEDALVIAVFTILIAGGIGTILIRWFSPFLLIKVSFRCRPTRYI